MRKQASESGRDIMGTALGIKALPVLATMQSSRLRDKVQIE
jgi:hypothetical protein